MKLTQIDLIAIANALEQLAKVNAKVNNITVHGFSVNVMRVEDQMDGVSYVVTRVEEGSPQSSVRVRTIKDNPQA